jgi:predicted O-methyltransferase YrrM
MTGLPGRRARRRRLLLGLSTLFGARPQGFFIPYRHAADVRPAAYPALEPLFEAAAGRFDEVLQALDALAAELRALGGSPPAPRFDQAWFPRLDAAAAYAIVRTRRPARIVEVGSGHSTRFLARAVLDGRLATRITCIDPEPRASLAGLDVDWQRSLVQDVAADALVKLMPGDLLFIDSSHVLMPGSDVDRLLGDVVPRLAAGTLLHLHDVFLPDPYPESWAWRGYNEQCALAPLLTGGGFDLVFASRYLATRHPARLQKGVLRDLPLDPAAFESSLWLEKRR